MMSRAVAAAAAATFVMYAGFASASEQDQKAPAAHQFKSLNRVVASPMSKAELSSVKGMHVHFLDGSGNTIHEAGTMIDSDGDGVPNNWENLGGSDGMPVAPSYHGLCGAMSVGVGGISIPGGAVQCP